MPKDLVFDFLERDEPFYTSDPYYDMFDGGYIKPKDFLKDEEQIKIVDDAIKTIKAFFSQAEGKKLIDYS